MPTETLSSCDLCLGHLPGTAISGMQGWVLIGMATTLARPPPSVLVALGSCSSNVATLTVLILVSRLAAMVLVLIFFLLSNCTLWGLLFVCVHWSDGVNARHSETFNISWVGWEAAQVQCLPSIRKAPV